MLPSVASLNGASGSNFSSPIFKVFSVATILPLVGLLNATSIPILLRKIGVPGGIRRPHPAHYVRQGVRVGRSLADANFCEIACMRFSSLFARRSFTSIPCTLFPFTGAGDGNRTHAVSLGSWYSTIELHPLSKTYYRTKTLSIFENLYTGILLPYSSI